MSTHEAEVPNPAMEAHVRLMALGMNLKAHGFTVETAAGGLIVRNPTATAPRCCWTTQTSSDTITCGPYEKDGGRYWYFMSWRQPIAECEHVPDAIVMIKGYLGAPT
ncbi:hypothetical protein [Actinomadura algeriensis]|uniref:Uncharacterized protein n=1 Tax=Actinomadura algeriensis TaxID=1679523 RepID=A0ABR9JJY7_9ACTN|nr:hypothetical protein [Actinomadura algeriensis]MBE1530875.1 hypothetical protein [Actinomadura algeriensis]